MDKPTLHISLCVRIAIAVLTRTVFQPDEYFQSLEPAFQLIFGYGHLTWEWLAEKPIRSIIYPAVNVPVYWLLKVTGLAYAGWFGDLLLVGVHCRVLFIPPDERSLDPATKSPAWGTGSGHRHMGV